MCPELEAIEICYVANYYQIMLHISIAVTMGVAGGWLAGALNKAINK